MDQPQVFILIGDCLRYANVSERTMPFVTSHTDLQFDRCYAPSTWTLPSHASLYSSETPIEHEVTRRGTELDASQALLPNRAREHGYRTALFSENPTFSGWQGFDHGIDFVDDFINSKLFVSDFSLERIAGEPSPKAAITAGTKIPLHPHRVKNSINALYGAVSYVRGTQPTKYPHHGDRVFSHVTSYAQSGTDPLFCIANLLDTHNPHNAPPDAGANALDLSVPADERAALDAANDNKIYLLESSESPPEETQNHFPTWSDVFQRQEEIYDAQIRYFDLLIEQWVDEMNNDVLQNSLIIITGDHGQLFGEEGMVGHHTSLHPHGIHVPLFVKTPERWESSRESISTPLSWKGLSRALEAVVAGEITDRDQFSEQIERESTTSDGILVTADGPNWNVESLREQYDSKKVDQLAVRKVGFIREDRMLVYESRWGETSIDGVEYSLEDDSRSFQRKLDEVDLDSRYEQWLRNSPRENIDTDVSQRLKQLGYM